MDPLAGTASHTGLFFAAMAKVLLGMSGGVDSSVAAALLREEGHDVIGMTIKTYNYEDVGGSKAHDTSCCSLDGINDAREVLRSGGAPRKCVIVTQSQVTSTPSQRDSV